MGDSRAAHIAVVGGGISGLVFARELSNRGLRATVFDTGEKAVGGRASTRDAVDDLGRALSWDHSTQYFTATPGSAFEAMAREWLSLGLIAEWPDDRVGVLDAETGAFTPFRDGAKRYVGVGGLKKLTSHLADAERVSVMRPKWVGAMTPSWGSGKRDTETTRPNAVLEDFEETPIITSWNLASGPSPKAERLGAFDFVAVAHNGKCAARLASTAKFPDGTPAAASLERSLQCAFGVRPAWELKKQRKLILSSVWALMVAFDEPLEFPDSSDLLEGAHVAGSDVIAWCSNVTAKRAHGGTSSSSVRPECWVIHSTPTYARDNKCPQEAVPQRVAEKVTREMLAAFEQASGKPKGSLPKPSVTRVQLWGAANPLTAAGVPAVFDSKTKTGACGDWCAGPPSIEAASASALALADAVEALFLLEKAKKPEAAAALDAARTRWTPCTGAGVLGGFPGTDAPAMPEPKETPKQAGGRGGGGRGASRGFGRGGRGRGRGGGRGGGLGGGGGRGGGGVKKTAVVSASAVAYGRAATAWA
jgi:predicted NAD/FAD-dependent oxidoreductase